MKFFTLLPAALLCFSLLYSPRLQAQTANATQQIDQQIWEPFKTSYRNYDHQAFNDLHSDDIVRISSKKIILAADYKKQNADWFSKAKEEGYQQSIEFRFDKRVHTGNKAYETGYYKVVVIRPDGEESTYFARFHVALEQVAGRWKITQDWDSNELNSEQVGALDFYRTASSDGEASTCTIDFVKVLHDRKAETLYYYENNWKKLREDAIKKGYIRSFQLLVNESSEEKDYDILLLTEYGTQEQYDKKEEHFRALIDARQAEGRQLLNEHQPADFREIVEDLTLRSR